LLAKAKKKNTENPCFQRFIDFKSWRTLPVIFERQCSRTRYMLHKENKH